MDTRAASTELIERLQAKRAKLIQQGRLIEARTVEQCIKLARQAVRPTG